jgi:hypothetical protein
MAWGSAGARTSRLPHPPHRMAMISPYPARAAAVMPSTTASAGISGRTNHQKAAVPSIAAVKCRIQNVSHLIEHAPRPGPKARTPTPSRQMTRAQPHFGEVAADGSRNRFRRPRPSEASLGNIGRCRAFKPWTVGPNQGLGHSATSGRECFPSGLTRRRGTLHGERRPRTPQCEMALLVRHEP